MYDAWWTKEEGAAYSDGEFTARAFFGDYAVTVSHDGETALKDIKFLPGSMSVEISL